LSLYESAREENPALDRLSFDNLNQGGWIMNNLSLASERRRQFIKNASGFACMLPLASLDLPWLHSQSPRENALAAQRPTRIDIADQREPGTRILIRGTIYDLADKPVPNVRIFLYQTDAAGYYSRPVNNPRQARLRGTVWSNAQGEYEFSSVQPGHYADMKEPPPMHIHVHLHAPGLPDHWVDSYYFAGDPRLSERDLRRASESERFSNIIRLTPGAAEVRPGVRHFRIDPALAERNQLVNGWYRQ
jgi:protocatechuate 3,4-dioxygenase beta subunit